VGEGRGLDKGAKVGKIGKNKPNKLVNEQLGDLGDVRGK